MTEANVEIVREIYARFNKRDYEGMWELMADDLEFRAHGFLDWGLKKRTVVGRDRVVEWFRDAFTAFGDFRMEPKRLIDLGDHVVVEIRDIGRGKHSGVDVDLNVFALWTLRDGKGARFESFETLEDALVVAERKEPAS